MLPARTRAKAPKGQTASKAGLLQKQSNMRTFWGISTILLWVMSIAMYALGNFSGSQQAVLPPRWPSSRLRYRAKFWFAVAASRTIQEYIDDLTQIPTFVENEQHLQLPLLAENAEEHASIQAPAIAADIQESTSMQTLQEKQQALQTISFTVCNGFANQRLALLSGLILAKETGRTVILPGLIMYGRQDEADANYGADGTVDFSDFYDTAAFKAAMQHHGISFASNASRSGSFMDVDEDRTMEVLEGAYTEDHLRLGCPLLRVNPDIILKHEDLIFSYLDALVPNEVLAAKVTDVVNHLRSSTSVGKFNFLHLRIESDWMAHCTRWKYGDNCFSNSLEVHLQLQIKQVENDVPLYIACDWEAVPEPIVMHVMVKLRDSGFSVITRKDILGDLGLPREQSALIEYYIALQSHKFMGNSVSTFTAVLLLERERKEQWASYYNMGDIPLAAFIPLYRMPWVFTYNGGSPSFDYMVRTAVITSLKARLKPYCLYNGTSEDPIFKWLQEHNVVMMLFSPSWKVAMERVFPEATKNVAWSPLYGSIEALFGTYQRLDIPVAWQLEQYNYVLFTDADIIFKDTITLMSFEKPLPIAVQMAYEMDNIFPCNAGVMLMNLPYLRQTYSAFVKFAFSLPSLYYPGYGPGDQGAYNQFYEKEMGSACTLNERFNYKPYKSTTVVDHPLVVHFHGPKPHHYLEWKHNNTCAFGDMCGRGIDVVCRILEESSAEMVC